MEICSRFTGMERKNGAFLLHTDNADVKVCFVTDEIVRVRASFDHELAEEPYVLMTTAWEDRIKPLPDAALYRSTRIHHTPDSYTKRELVGAGPLHLAYARPFGRLKAPLGLSLLRCAAQTRACLWQAEQAHHTTSKEKQSVPDGERPVVHIAIVCGFWQGASGWTHPVFVSSWLVLRCSTIWANHSTIAGSS